MPLRTKQVLAFVTAVAAFSIAAAGVHDGTVPFGFLLAAAVLGMTFAALLLWGKRQKRFIRAVCIAWITGLTGMSINEQVFFGPKGDLPSLAVIYELVAWLLGVLVLLPLTSRAYREPENKTNNRANPNHS